MKPILISRREALKKIGITSATAFIVTTIFHESHSSLSSYKRNNNNNETDFISGNIHHKNKMKKGWISIYCSNIY